MTEIYTYFTNVGIVKKAVLQDGQSKYLIEVDNGEGTLNYCLLPPHRAGVSMEEIMDPEAHANHPAELLLLVLYGLDKLTQVMSTENLDIGETLRCQHQRLAFQTFLQEVGFREIIIPPYNQQWLH